MVEGMEEENKIVIELLKNEDIRQFYATELRAMELSAFSIVLSTLRAQGALTEKRKEVIGAIKVALNISEERYMAEIRRVASDERLCQIAERVVGDSGCLDWTAAGYNKNEFSVFPAFVQIPLNLKSINLSTESIKVDLENEVPSSPESPTVAEQPFDPNLEENRILFENGWSSDSDDDMQYAMRIERPGSDTEEQKIAAIKASMAAASALRKKQKKLDKERLTPVVRKNQTSPDITAVSPTKLDQSFANAKFNKPPISPVMSSSRGRKRKIAPPVKAVGRKIPKIPTEPPKEDDDDQVYADTSYATISALAKKLGIARGPGRGRGSKAGTSRGTAGRGRGVRGMRKVTSTPRQKKSPKVEMRAETDNSGNLILVEMKPSRQSLTPKQRIKVKVPKEEKPPTQRKKKKLEIKNECVGNLSAGAARRSVDDMIDVNLECHESIHSPEPESTNPDEESRPLVNNNLDNFGNYEAESRVGEDGSSPRPPVPVAPVKPSRARAKSSVPAKMRHKAAKHNMFNHELSNFDDPTRVYNPPLMYIPPSSINNYYTSNELTMPIPPPGVNPPPGIRPRGCANTSISVTPNFGYGGGTSVITSNYARSPVRNSLPTPIFSTTLNANSLHKKRTQVLLPSTYQTQTPTPGEMNFDAAAAATASSLAVAARNRSNLYDQQQRQNLGLGLSMNSVTIRPSSVITTAQVQRKAQPHILSSSKLHRTAPPVLNTTTSPPANGGTNSLPYNPAVSVPPVEAGSSSSTMIGSPMTIASQAPIGGNGGNENSMYSSTVTSVQNFQASSGNPLTTSNNTVIATVPAGIGMHNMNVVRGQGANIIFLQRASPPISGTSGTLPIASHINQTIMSPGTVPFKNSRAVILRRGNKQGNLMVLDVQPNNTTPGQVPQLLQTARLITGSSDLTMLNMPAIVASSAGPVNIGGRKLVTTPVPTMTAEPMQHFSTSPTKATDMKSFRPVTKSIQVLTTQSPMFLGQDNPGVPVNYLTKFQTSTLRPAITSIPSHLQSIPSSVFVPGSKGIEATIMPASAPMNVVHFENDIVHEEEVNTSSFIEYTPSLRNNMTGSNTPLETSSPNKNWNLSNSSLQSGSSSTDTASESESYPSPYMNSKIAGNTNVNSECRRAELFSEDIFETALKSSGIELYSAPSLPSGRAENLEDQKDESTNNPTSNSDSHSHAVLKVNSNAAGPVTWND